MRELHWAKLDLGQNELLPYLPPPPVKPFIICSRPAPTSLLFFYSSLTSSSPYSIISSLPYSTPSFNKSCSFFLNLIMDFSFYVFFVLPLLYFLLFFIVFLKECILVSSIISSCKFLSRFFSFFLRTISISHFFLRHSPVHRILSIQHSSLAVPCLTQLLPLHSSLKRFSSLSQFFPHYLLSHLKFPHQKIP